MISDGGSPLGPPESLTLQQAAHLLNVSRAYLVNQILEVYIQTHRCGKRRMVYLKDAVNFMKQQEIEREKLMANLAALSQELGLLK